MNTNDLETQNYIRDQRTGRFLPGNTGGGRPKGSRNKLGEQFISDLYEAWQKSGVCALQRMAADDPSAFVKTVAGILPKEVDATLNVDVQLFSEAKTFVEAYRLARDYIGAHDEPLMIEGETNNAGDA